MGLDGPREALKPHNPRCDVVGRIARIALIGCGRRSLHCANNRRLGILPEIESRSGDHDRHNTFTYFVHLDFISCLSGPCRSAFSVLTLTLLFIELQGRAVKTQDLLVASGTLSLKGSDGLSALDEDIEAARVVCLYSADPPRGRVMSEVAHF